MQLDLSQFQDFLQIFYKFFTDFLKMGSGGSKKNLQPGENSVSYN